MKETLRTLQKGRLFMSLLFVGRFVVKELVELVEDISQCHKRLRA